MNISSNGYVKSFFGLSITPTISYCVERHLEKDLKRDLTN